MLSEVLRKAMMRVPNRFQLAVIAAERSAQLLQGARPAVDNSRRERVMKVALREIAEAQIVFEGESWKVKRPASAFEQIFALPARHEVAEASAPVLAAAAEEE